MYRAKNKLVLNSGVLTCLTLLKNPHMVYLNRNKDSGLNRKVLAVTYTI